VADGEATIRITGDGSGAEKALDGVAAAAKRLDGAITGEVSPALARAEAAIEKFGAAAESGGRGVGRFGTQAKLAMDIAQRELQQLAADGKVNLGQVETALERLNQKFAQGAAAAGRMRAAQREVDDELKVATARAGELEGQIGSLEDIANQLSPTLGKATMQLLALQAAFGMIEGLGRDLASGLGDLSKAFGANQEEASKVEKKIGDLFTATGLLKASIASLVEPVKTAFRFYSDGLSDSTTKTGELIDKTRELLDLRKTEAANAEAVSKRLFGDPEKYIARANATVDAIRAEMKAHELNAEQIKAVRAELQSLVDQAARMGAQVPAQVQSLADEFGVTGTAAADLSARVEAAFAQIDKTVAAGTKPAVDHVAALREQLDKLRNEAGKPASTAGGGTTSSAAKPLADMNSQAEKLRATIDELNRKPIQSAEDVAQLDAAREQLADLNIEINRATIAAQALGPAISDSVTQVDALQVAWEKVRLGLELNQAEHDAAMLAAAISPIPVRIEEAADGTRILTNVTEELGRTGDVVWTRNGEVIGQTGEALDHTGKVVEEVSEKVKISGEVNAKAFADQTVAVVDLNAALDETISRLERIQQLAETMPPLGGA
jgi:chromosome segregation ATPase